MTLTVRQQGVYPAGKYKTDTDWLKALNKFKQTILNPLKFNSTSVLLIKKSNRLKENRFYFNNRT